MFEFIKKGSYSQKHTSKKRNVAYVSVYRARSIYINLHCYEQLGKVMSISIMRDIGENASPSLMITQGKPDAQCFNVSNSSKKKNTGVSINCRSFLQEYCEKWNIPENSLVHYSVTITPNGLVCDYTGYELLGK